MALKINAGDAKPANNFFNVDPEELIVDDKDNSRKVSAEAVKEMAASLRTEGQLQPILVRRVDDDKLKVVVGVTRTKAAMRLNAQTPDQPIRLTVQVVPDGMTDAEAYRASVVENFQRTNPSPLEIAKQQQKLMEDFGMDPKQVAAIFYSGVKAADAVERVTAMQKILTLPAEVKRRVDNRDLPQQAAIELAGLPEADQLEILATAERMGGGTGRIKGEDVRAKARAKKGKEPAESKQGVGLREFKDFLIGLTGPAEDKAVRALATKLEAFLNGELGLEAAERAFRSLGGVFDAAAVAEVAKAVKAQRKAEEKAAADAAQAETDAKEAAKAEAKAAKEAAKAAKAKPKAAPAKAAAKAKPAKTKGKAKAAPVEDIEPVDDAEDLEPTIDADEPKPVEV